MDLLIKTDSQPPRAGVSFMFDRIAKRYDLLNHILSLGQDIFWRKKVGTFLLGRSGQYLLDLATGTGDQLLYLMKNSDKIEKAVGIDLSTEMLTVGREKIRKQQLDNCIILEEGDVENIEYRNDTFDAVTIAFGIRNVTDVKQSISEMYRVLKPEGRVIILEFSIPENRFIRRIYLFYFRYLLPQIGSLISGDGHAYRYLNKTVETFPYGDKFCNLLTSAGFEKVSMYPQSFGIVTIYHGDKPRQT
jgi:demethylmenaquinone methyltransferase/2-methoxy-6-polyprenyl-1,4-benzoquinol methylase